MLGAGSGWWNRKPRDPIDHGLAARGISTRPRQIRVQSVWTAKGGKKTLPNHIQDQSQKVTKLLRKIARGRDSRTIQDNTAKALAEYRILRHKMKAYMKEHQLPEWTGKDWTGKENWLGDGYIYRQLKAAQTAESKIRVQSAQAAIKTHLGIK